MTRTLNITLGCSVVGDYTADDNSGTLAIAEQRAERVYRLLFGTGTGSNQGNVLYSKQHSLSSTPTNLDLNALVDMSGVARNLNRMSLWYIENTETVAAGGGSIYVGGNVLVGLGLVGYTAQTEEVRAGGVWVKTAPLTGLKMLTTNGIADAVALTADYSPILANLVIVGEV